MQIDHMQSCSDKMTAPIKIHQCYPRKSTLIGMYHCHEEITLFHHHKVFLSLDYKQRKTRINHLDPVFMQGMMQSKGYL